MCRMGQQQAKRMGVDRFSHARISGEREFWQFHQPAAGHGEVGPDRGGRVPHSIRFKRRIEDADVEVA